MGGASAMLGAISAPLLGVAAMAAVGLTDAGPTGHPLCALAPAAGPTSVISSITPRLGDELQPADEARS